MNLSPHELRVLGCLIEKEITTPDLYPLSLNALQAAANQRSSRDPVLDLTEDDLRQALHSLEDRGLASPARGSLGSSGSRVSKYEHHARTVLNLRRDETALLCLLLLRGPQTPGELRSRADRLYSFDDLAAVTATLDRLAARPAPGLEPGFQPGPQSESQPNLQAESRSESQAGGPLTAPLPRQPGSREIRYTHLLGGNIASQQTASVLTAMPVNRPTALVALEDRIATLEQRIARLESRLAPENQPDQPGSVQSS